MIDADRLRSILDYNPHTGLFAWRQRGRGRRLHQPVGCLTRFGHRQIWLSDRPYLAHRLAWLYVYGEWPARDLDHVNGLPDDNRITNLRLATVAENQQNQHGLNRRNTSGHRGVSRRGRRWRAGIQIDGRTVHLGYFSSPEEAAAAYDAARPAHVHR